MIVSTRCIFLFSKNSIVFGSVCVREEAKSKCGQVTLLRAASMADQATACGQLANVNVTSFCSPGLKLKE